MAIFEKFKSAVRSMTGGHERHIVVKQPDDHVKQQTLALIEQGNALEDAGQLVEARALYENAVQMAPTLAKTHVNLGNVLLALDQPEAAIEAYMAALVQQPDLAAAYFNIGNAQVACSRLREALSAYDQALALNAGFVDALVAKGNVQGDLKDFESAIASYQKALQLSPHYSEVLLNLGNAFRALDRFNEAVQCFNQVLSLSPASPELHRNFGLAFRGLDRLGDAVTSFSKAVALKPDYATAQIDLANTYRELGEISKAIEVARLAITLDPNESGAWSLLFFCLSDSGDVDKQTLFAEHRRFGEHFEPQFQPNWQPHQNLRDTERVLQVGVVSGDLSNHAVASFFEPVLLQLLTMSALSIHIYETSGREDNVTRRIKAQVKHWNDVEMLSADKLANLIRQDGIDVLIDLSGHTPANRLLTFARKPAPIQMSWIGYPGTTGMQTMDYFIGDRHVFPVGEFDAFFTEKIIRIPATAAFQSIPNPPCVNALPALKNGFITFASFNRIDKISKAVIVLWSQLLSAIPDSKMLLGGLPLNENFEQLTEWFAAEGVPSERLVFHRRCSMDAYLELHHHVDICLDTFPYGGGTTTCHALWMGVPILTLAGNTPAGRVAAGLLSHLDIHKLFVASDKLDFVNKGRWCAANIQFLEDLRRELRARFKSSALSQPSIVAGGFEYSVRHAWHRWCAGLPAENFEVVHNQGRYCISEQMDIMAKQNT